MAIDTEHITRQHIKRNVKAAPLAAFRIFFGLMMLFSIIRFWSYGWIEKVYLEPLWHFHYLGFEWLDVPGQWIYLIFGLCGMSAIGITLGYKYRLSTTLFFLSFTYIELLEKTTYLNHYYFVSVVSFVLIWLPSHAYFSLDAKKNESIRAEYIPVWNINIIKLLLSLVYIYAGLAKLNYDWMVNALPLAIWLPSKTHIPIIGQFMDDRWLHYVFSWSGALYDCFIVFFLMWRKTRMIAYATVIFFHVMTGILFQIGMFPYIMIVSTLIFFSSDFHDKFFKALSQIFSIDKSIFDNKIKLQESNVFSSVRQKVLIGFIIIQVLFPWRFLLYPGSLFWHEEGYRFSWRVMLMEKTGYANFKVVDGQTGKFFYVQNSDFLTPLQEKQMSTQADFIIEYAHLLANHFAKDGHQNIEIYVENVVSLNGRKSQTFIDPKVNLLNLKNNFKHRDFIVPLND